MSNRITALQVVLDEPMREDDAQAVIEAIRLMRGVVAVRPVEADMRAEEAAAARRDVQWTERILAVVSEQRRS